MKTRKVRRVAFHIGVNINSNVRTHLDSDKHKEELQDMSISQIGIIVRDKSGMDTLIPYANCHWIMLGPEPEEEDGPRRGRPPKQETENP